MSNGHHQANLTFINQALNSLIKKYNKFTIINISLVKLIEVGDNISSVVFILCLNAWQVQLLLNKQRRSWFNRHITENTAFLSCLLEQCRWTTNEEHSLNPDKGNREIRGYAVSFYECNRIYAFLSGTIKKDQANQHRSLWVFQYNIRRSTPSLR